MFSIFPDNIDTTGLQELTSNQIHIKAQSVDWINWKLPSTDDGTGKNAILGSVNPYAANNVNDLMPGGPPAADDSGILDDARAKTLIFTATASLLLTLSVW